MLERGSRIPLHSQIENLMRENLSNSIWEPGGAIPSENELSSNYGVSRMTVRNVITKLVQEDLLERIPGKGTYVRERKIFAKSLSYGGVREQLEEMGYEVTTKLVFIKKKTVNEKINLIFNSSPNTIFYEIQRLRFVKGVPLSIHTSYVPLAFCVGLEKEDLENEQLCIVLNKTFNLKQGKMNETLESVAATKKEAEILQVKTGHPLLLLEDIIMKEDGTPYEYAKVVFRGDKYKIHLEF